jgi:DNA-binding CsgD family transcriptional regulator
MLDALGATLVGGRLASSDEIWFEVARAAQALPLPPEAQTTVVDTFIEGLVALFLKGHSAGAPALRRAVDALDLDRDSPEMLRLLGCGCWVAGALGDDQRLHEVAFRVEKLARDQGALVALSNALIFLGLAEVSAGSLVEADTYFAQSSAIVDDRRRPSIVGEVMVQAWRGHEDARQQAAVVARDAAERGQGWALPFVEYSVTVWELGRGSYEAALESAPRQYWDNPFFDSIATPEVVEAAVRGGDPALAREKVASFSERALTNGTPLALGQLARVRALVAADGETEALYRRAISLLNQSRSISQLARTRLLYGEWLRRANRRVDAREQLRTAEEMFAGMGAKGFAQRARSELAATGEHARKRTVDTMDDLTPQETQIASLASQGATNAEIGARLFISSNTVDYHLRKVYRKLSVTSRRQLARALAG